ncbi:MAG TPA: translocation/assembly module TamB domain-containing protein, partial [Azoarcus sp.]|nr:translocation/assembly module TamB domain-containing protein [Azoarcus sp.]
IENHAEAGWRFAPGAELEGGVDLDIPSIEWLGRLLQEGTQLEGALKAQVELGGTPEQPDFSGRIEGHELAAALVEEGVSLAGGELLATFDRDWLRLERLEFITPNRVRPANNTMRIDELIATPGRFIATGVVDLASGDGLFDFEADRLPVLQRPDRWLLLSGEGEAVTTWSGLVLDAEFRADAGYIEFAETPPPSLSNDVVILVGEDEEDTAETGGFDVSADIDVRLGEALHLSALGLETRLTGELSLRMRPGEEMSATGSIATAGGVYKGYGQDLTIDRGMINFQGELGNPGLNIVALRKGLEVEAGVSVTGTARRPVIRLVSQPDVPDPAKLSWIMLGRAPSGEGGGDLAMLLPAAQAMLGGNMTDSLSKSLGVDEFSIGQSSGGSMASSQVVDGGRVGGSSGIGGQVVTIGKRLSPDLFLAFEQGLGGADSLVKMTYQLTRRISLVASGGGDDNAGDAYYTITFR